MISRGADAARDRVAVLAAFDELPVVVQKALDAGTLVLNDLAGQLLPAPQIVPLPRMMILRQFGPVLWFMSPAFKRLE